MDGLSDVKPTPPTPSEVDYRTFILSQAEEEKLLDLFQFAVLSAWQNHVPAAEKLNIPRLEVKHSQFMKAKTEKVRSDVILLQ